MGFKNLEDMQRWKNRRSERMGKVGRMFEKEVEKILERMVEEDKLATYVAHPPNSKEDHSGRDFTVEKVIEGVTITRSFGVTISTQRWQRAKILHADVPQLCFPPGTKPETIGKRILELFSL